MPRVSIGTAAYACWWTDSSTTWAAAANTGSSTDAGAPSSWMTLLPYVLVDEDVGVDRGEVVDHRRKALVVDDHELARVLGDVAVVGDDERDRVADEANLALGQRRSRRLRRRRTELGVPLLVHTRVEVLGDEHRADAGQRPSLRNVDRDDPAPSDGAAHEAGVEHARPLDVVDEGAATPQEACRPRRDGTRLPV